MPRYEYKVVPAPRKGQKAKGLKTPEDRYALAVTEVMNRMAAAGWHYLRADALPSEERTGWTSKSEVIHHLLVFRRELAPEAEEPQAAEAPLRLTPSARRDDVPAPHGPRLGPARTTD